ncbi:copper resistance protein CopC [Lichenicoccus roseus]|uniref:copper resistance protein CopC n=1 Tax=Lichenicoccus roseus TaxID=2683649 RepID=UPI0014868811|nr:copper resistance protein CopC [Lichenicoccus roseus]
MSKIHRSHRHLLTICAFLAGLILAPAAEAHAHLMVSHPVADATGGPPGDIELRFSEAPLAMLSSIELRTATGEDIPVSSKDMGKNMLVVVPQRPLKSGSYTVKWHVVTADTHRTQGTFAFIVR